MTIDFGTVVATAGSQLDFVEFAPLFELLPYIDLCTEAKLNKKRRNGEPIDSKIIQIPTDIDPDLVKEVCAKSRWHSYTGLQTFN